MIRYAADPPEARLAAPLDDFTAIFHRPSGITHLLVSPAPELLDALIEGPADAAELLKRLSARYEVSEADPAAIDARLEELATAGLVWRA